MSDREKNKRFRAERWRQLRRGILIQRDTLAEILRQLQEAGRRISGALASGASSFETWRLGLLQGEIRRAMATWEGSAGGALATGMAQSWEAGSDLVIQPLAAAGVELTGALPALDTRMLEAMRVFQTDRIRDISTTAVNKINTEIAQATIGVQTPFEAASKVGEILKSPADRARTIVRTELGTVYSEAGQQRMQQAVAAGVTGLQKQWRRSGKLHPRLPHELADGQIVDVDKPFLVGGVPIIKPRDPALAPKERINCGCSSLPHMRHWQVQTPGAKPYTPEELARSRAARQAEEVRLPP